MDVRVLRFFSRRQGKRAFPVRLMGEKYPLNAWFRKNVRSLNVVATYSLLYNASLMAEDGLGYRSWLMRAK